MQTVHLRVNDAATGQPTPVRLRCTGPDGTYYAPFGRLTRLPETWSTDCAGNVRIDGRLWAYIDGACEIRLPVGPVRVEVSKGPEYVPLDETVSLGPGKMAMRLTIRRWTDERQHGWFSGELGAHALTPHAALLEGAAEDLAVVNLLAREEDGPEGVRTPNLLAFSGQAAALERPGHLVAVNTLNTHPELGRLALLHGHRVVYPLRFGGTAGPDDWTLADWCDQCHRKAGLVVWDNPEARSMEALANVLLRRIDATRVCLADFDNWYPLLDFGLCLPLCDGNVRSADSPLGRLRTYARLRPEEELNYKHWVEAVRTGRTYVTEGPLLEFRVEGAEVGAKVEVDRGKPSVRVTAGARSHTSFSRIELVQNGRVQGDCPAQPSEVTGQPWTATLDAAVTVAQSGWLAVRCWDEPAGRYVAHSSPIYVSFDNQPVLAPGAQVDKLLANLDRTAGWVEREARCETDAQRQRLANVFRDARRVLEGLPRG